MDKLHSYQGWSGRLHEWRDNFREWREEHRGASLVDLPKNISSAKNQHQNGGQEDYSHIYRSDNFQPPYRIDFA